MTNRTERCSGCRFWVFFSDDIDDHIGTCHRYPPTIPYEEDVEEDQKGSTSPLSGEWTGPNTRGTYWCGEFKAELASPTRPATPSDLYDALVQANQIIGEQRARIAELEAIVTANPDPA